MKSTRRITRRKALRLIAAGAASCVADAFFVEPRILSVTRRDISCVRLSSGLELLRIGLLSDFHFRPGVDDDLLDKVVATVRRERLDLVALTGDYISREPRVVPLLLEHLAKLNAAHGVFAVLGNHDGWAGSRSLIGRQFEKAGISFLINGHSTISIRNDRLAIAGTDFVWLGKPDPARTLHGVDRRTPVLALVHEPDYFDTMTGSREIMLQLSGHTHGGQCRVPFMDYVPRTVSLGRKYIHGLYSRGNSNLFVTRGVGTVGPRVRFACPPELAVLTLRAR